MCNKYVFFLTDFGELFNSEMDRYSSQSIIHQTNSRIGKKYIPIHIYKHKTENASTGKDN